MSAKDRIIELEDEKKQRDEWELTSSSYELFQPMPGTLVYRMEPSEYGNNLPVYFCTSCHNKKIKSVLQASDIQARAGMGRTVIMKCNHCDACYHFPLGLVKAGA